MLGPVAAETGACLGRAVEAEQWVYRPLALAEAVSPIILSTRKGEKSPEVALLLKLLRGIYRKEGITFGV